MITSGGGIAPSQCKGIDGTPCAVKIAFTVWSRGKGEDNIKALPITIRSITKCI